MNQLPSAAPPLSRFAGLPPSGWQNKPLYTFLQNHAAPCESSDMLSFRGKVVAPASKGGASVWQEGAYGGRWTADSRQPTADSGKQTAAYPHRDTIRGEG